MKLVILQRKLIEEEAKNICSLPDPVKIIYEDAAYMHPDLLSFDNKKVSVSNEALRGCAAKALEEVQSFGHRQFGQYSIIEWLGIEGTDNWFNLRFLLNVHHRTARTAAAHIKDVIDEDEWGRQAEHIEVYGNDPDVQFLVDYPEKSVRFIQVQRKKKSSLTYLLKFGWLFFVRVFLTFFQLPNFFRKNKHLVLTNVYNQRKVLNVQNGSYTTADPTLHYFLEEGMRSKTYLQVTEAFPRKIGSVFQLSGKLYWPVFSFRSIAFEPFILFALFSPSFYKQRSALKKKLGLLQQQMDKQVATPDEKVLFRKMIGLSRLMHYYLLRKRAAGILFSFFPASESLSCIDENGSQCRPVIVEAKARGIRTIGIQHGLIYPLHVSYMYSDQDNAYDPIPDHTIVWGKSWKEILVNQSIYRAERVHVLGHLLTDGMEFFKALKKEEVVKTSGQKPLIVYASQPLFEGQQGIRRQLATDFLKLSAEFPQAHFVIKPHPNEKEDSFFHGVAAGIDRADYQIYRGDLYGLLAVADMVVIYYSTVGLEAGLFGKKLIVLDYWDMDMANYIQSKLGQKASCYDELRRLTKDFLVEGQAADDQLNLQHHFDARKHVAKRYVECIDSLDKEGASH